jgi:ubiquinone/menaquinone biosynthesis C-methylase UbiE
MATSDNAFAGSIPAIYDRHLGPLLFQPYAEELARRGAQWQPRRILETAAGTGLVTAALAEACPDAEIVATDLNPAMLDVANQRIRSERVSTQAADAQELPFTDGEFDLVVCQFGVMFFHDKVRANREARRMLRDGGRYLLAIWDELDRNPASQLVHRAVAGLFPSDPPGFLARTPFGYADPAAIEHDLLAAGFTDIEFETVKLPSRAEARPEDAATGLVLGSPLKMEIEERDPAMLDRAQQAALKALQELVEGDSFRSELSAHIVTAIR